MRAGLFADLQVRKTADSSLSVAYQFIFHTLLRTQFVEAHYLLLCFGSGARYPILKQRCPLYVVIYTIHKYI